MFTKILLPTDFSDYSWKTAECAGQIAGVREIVLLHVLDAARASTRAWLSGHTSRSPLEKAQALLDKQRMYLEDLGFAVTTYLDVVEDGDIKGAILRRAEKEQVPLIVMGARGKGIIQGYLLGSVSADVLRFGTTDVLITHFPGTVPVKGELFSSCRRNIFSTVLCPVDFSKPSREAIEFMKRLDAVEEVVLVHVISSAESKEELDSAVQNAERRLGHLKAELEREDRTVKTFVRFGNPCQEIADLAEEEDVSLILISRYGNRDYFRDIPLGSTATDVAKHVKRSVYVRYPRIHLTVQVRELLPEEFWKAEEIWQQYHQQKADREHDRIFGVFLDENLVSVARCKRHPDGLEVDGVFTPEEFRRRGYARKAMEALVSACGDEVLYMHSTRELVSFYSTFGFRPISEKELPPKIRERYVFALGNMEGANVRPMRRVP